MKLKLLFLIAVCVAVVQAQHTNTESSQSDGKQITKVVRVHGDAFAISNLLGRSGTVEHQATSAFKAIVLKGPAPDVDSMERTIQELDNLGTTSASKDVELTAVVMAGATEAIPGIQEVSGEPLGSVVKQLQSIFPYKSYQVLSTTVLRASQGNALHHSQGSLKWQERSPGEVRPALAYDFEFGPVDVSADRSIRLGVVRFSTLIPPKPVKVTELSSVPQKPSSQPVEIRTNVELREGQKVVVGSATVADADLCFFLVVSAKVVQ